jgi:hypothetical protein
MIFILSLFSKEDDVLDISPSLLMFVTLFAKKATNNVVGVSFTPLPRTKVRGYPYLTPDGVWYSLDLPGLLLISTINIAKKANKPSNNVMGFPCPGLKTRATHI